jgi:quercetin 2,3-dioxygenase
LSPTTRTYSSRATAIEDDRARLRVVSGAIEGVEAPTRNHTPVQYLDVRIEAGGLVSLPVAAAHNGFVLVLEGSVLVGPERVRGAAEQVLWMDFPVEGASGISSLAIVGETPSRVLVVSGEPIRERVVAYGPFVMNTEEEIAQAYRVFHSGKFGGPTPAALGLNG